jgi:UDP-N-acetylmuramate: L-alanyl-gamma-D-glutamyl-meso-diaminopimelate ligase
VVRMHFVGVATTFMADIAKLAKQGGHDVTASDSYIPPKMRCDLEIAGIITMEGFSSDNMSYRPELVILGDAIAASNVEVREANKRLLPCITGAQWLEEHIVRDRWSRIRLAQLNSSSSPKAAVKHAPRPSLAHPIKPRRIR